MSRWRRNAASLLADVGSRGTMTMRQAIGPKRRGAGGVFEALVGWCVAAILVAHLGAFAAVADRGFPIPTTPYRVEIAVVALAPEEAGDSNAQLEAEMAAELELWNRGGEGIQHLVTLARFEGPSVLHYPMRLSLPNEDRVDVTLIERDRRRLRALVSRTVGKKRVERVLAFKLNRSFRPAEGRVVVPLDEGRWLRLWVRRP